MPINIGNGLNGIHTNTPNHFILDVGIAWFNIDVSQLRGSAVDPMGSATAGAIRLGATRGGAKISTGKANRQIEVDGLRVPIVGLDRITMWAPALQVTLLEQSRVNMQAYLGSADVAYHAKYDEITPRVGVLSTDYLSNLCLFATGVGSAIPCAFVFENVLAINPVDQSLQDKSEMAVQVDFLSHAALSAPTSVPYHVFLPKGVASGS